MNLVDWFELKFSTQPEQPTGAVVVELTAEHVDPNPIGVATFGSPEAASLFLRLVRTVIADQYLVRESPSKPVRFERAPEAPAWIGLTSIRKRCSVAWSYGTGSIMVESLAFPTEYDAKMAALTLRRFARQLWGFTGPKTTIVEVDDRGSQMEGARLARTNDPKHR